MLFLLNDVEELCRREFAVCLKGVCGVSGACLQGVCGLFAVCLWHICGAFAGCVNVFLAEKCRKICGSGGNVVTLHAFSVITC